MFARTRLRCYHSGVRLILPPNKQGLEHRPTVATQRMESIDVPVGM